MLIRPQIVGNFSLSFAASVDVVTMGLLTFYLHRRQSSFRGYVPFLLSSPSLFYLLRMMLMEMRRTQRMIQKLMFYTVNTGIITAYAFLSLPPSRS